MLSRVLGLVRDVVFAMVIGATGAADAFFVAFKIPNFLRRLFAEGAFSQAFVPVLSEYRQKESAQAVKELVDKVTGCLGSVLVLLTGVAIVGSPLITAIFAPGFWDNKEKFELTSQLVRITFPYLLLISMTGLAGGILNSFDRFAAPAFTPVLLNLSLIAAALFAAPWFTVPAYALAWGVMVAGILQLLFQLPFLKSIHMLPRPAIDWHHAGVRRILKLMAPAIFGVSVSQINLLLDTVIASFLPGGSVSWLYYSDRLSELPLGVFAVAVATVILPNLSRQHAAQSMEEFSRVMDWGIRFILLLAIPASIALLVLAEPILLSLFFYGDVISSRDIQMSVLSLRAYTLGITFFMLIKVLAPGYYARQDMRTPVRIGIIAMVSNMVMNIVFVVPFHHYFHAGHAGLALATSLAAVINVSLLLKGLVKSEVYKPAQGWKRFLGQMLAANLSMLVLLVLCVSHFDQWYTWVWWERLPVLGLICVAGLTIYSLVLLATGVRLRHFRRH